jgi:hypothetical protein
LPKDSVVAGVLGEHAGDERQKEADSKIDLERKEKRNEELYFFLSNWLQSPPLLQFLINYSTEAKKKPL